MRDSVFALLDKSGLECYPIQVLWLMLLFPHFQLIMNQLVIGAPRMPIEFKRRLSTETVDPSLRIGHRVLAALFVRSLQPRHNYHSASQGCVALANHV
jgi:hypothetical protein